MEPCSQEPSTGPCPEEDESIPISPRSILILSSSLHLGFVAGLFSSGFQTLILYPFLFCLVFYMPCSSHNLWFDDHIDIQWSVQVMKLFII